ncbi:hypothetical protein GEMRC1_006658 [Eukaryota sp. GEM-RC1]
MTTIQLSCDNLCKTSVKHDFIVRFLDIEIPCHSVIIAQFSDFFYNLFALNLSDDQGTQDFSSLNVSTSSFRSFFSYLYAQPVEITLENLYEFYVLASYFVVEDLKKACLQFMTHYSISVDSLLSVFEQANECHDQEFLNHLLSVLNIKSFVACSETVRPQLVAKSCGSELSLSKNDSIIKKCGYTGHSNSFVQVNLSSCSYTVKFTRLDDLGSTTCSDFIGWKDISKLQDGKYPKPCIGTDGNYIRGSFSPPNPNFPPISKGESITSNVVDEIHLTNFVEEAGTSRQHRSL